MEVCGQLYVQAMKCGPQSQFGCGGEEKKCQPVLQIEPQSFDL
jgi:hypothetical protein